MAKRVRVLKRFGHKGQFVKYPHSWGRRMVHTGKRRFDTNCDLLVGLCACGERHTIEEQWIDEMLLINHARIETHEEWIERTRSERVEIKNI
jgi:hypothetical protein